MQKKVRTSKKYKKQNPHVILPTKQFSKRNQKTEHNIPELGGLGLVLVNQGCLHIIGGIKFRGLLCRRRSLGLGIMAGENAAIFGLNGPETTFVVHLRSGVLTDAADQIWVPAHPGGPLLRRH